MHRPIAAALSGLLVVVVLSLGQPASATTYTVEFSPPAAEALNLGTQTYPGDHETGLGNLNENPQNASTAHGDVLGAGITYDDVTNVLTFDFGYGSAFGFSDLQSDWNGGVHIHGNGTNTALFPAVNANAAVIYDLASSHVASGPRDGRVTGTRTLAAAHETWLFDNQLYVNIHTINLPGGEIRGQLVVTPEPGSAAALLLASAAMLARRRRRP